MRLVQVSGINRFGGIWNHNLPDKATVATLGSRMLVVAPSALYWIDSEGDVEPATAYPRQSPDDGA